jgi:peroxiredoxin
MSRAPLNASRRQLLALGLASPLLWSACSSDESTQMPSLPFTELDGQTRQLGDLKGKVTIVNFWATSCTSCVKEMPELVATHQKYKDRGLDTLAVAMSYDPPAYVMQFAQTRQLPFRVAMDHDGKLAEGFGKVQLTPTTFVIDRRGKIVKRYVGPPDFAALHRLLEKLLAA